MTGKIGLVSLVSEAERPRLGGCKCTASGEGLVVVDGITVAGARGEGRRDHME